MTVSRKLITTNHTSALKLCMLHDKCRLSRKSLISVLELEPLILVLEPRVLVNIRLIWLTAKFQDIVE